MDDQFRHSPDTFYIFLENNQVLIFEWRKRLPGIIAALTLLLLPVLVLFRARIMKRDGVGVIHFGKLDRKDFLIPPFVIFYFYLVFSAAFHWPRVSGQQFYHSNLLAWIGAFFCLAGLGLFLASLISFGKSFRVGIDTEQPDQLVTDGVFALSRNPIYVAFGLVLFGEFLVFPNWIILIYLLAAMWLFHRQVLREEQYLKVHYGTQYADYSSQVRRYL